MRYLGSLDAIMHATLLTVRLDGTQEATEPRRWDRQVVVIQRQSFGDFFAEGLLPQEADHGPIPLHLFDSYIPLV